MGALHPKLMFIKLPSTLYRRVEIKSYDCVSAARQQKPPFIFEANLNLPESSARQ